jgi:diguanylate cyclase (GGDEF)-like protein
VGKIVNIDDQMKETVKLKEKAQRDSLTKLSNARTTRKLIEQYIKDDYDACHAFIMVDIDNFKSINDCCGHLAGDKVLVQFAEELKKVFRSTDVLGRIGGDEFLVLLRGIQSDSLAEEKASAICGILNSIRLPGKDEVKVSGSVGISTYPADGCDYETLLKKADEALYEAKRKGKNRYCKFCDGF